MITEIDLPTEASIANEKDFQTDKSETFAELYDKYDELFIKNSSETTRVNEETTLRKRNSNDEDIEASDAEDKNKSVIEKIENIVDPEVRKEFELELPNNRQAADEESEKTTDVGTEYEPIYYTKVIVSNERQLVDDPAQEEVEDSGKSLIVDFTTFAPEELTSQPESIEVFEQVFNQTEEVRFKELTTQDPLNFHVDFDPIVVVPKNEFRNIFVDIAPETAETFTHRVHETTESTLLYLKGEDENLKPKHAERVDEVEEKIDNENISERSFGLTTVENETEAPRSPLPVESNIPETKTEVVEVRTEISVNILIAETSSTTEKSPAIIEIHQSSSNSDKSSEESNSSKSKEHEKKEDENSAESSEENSAKEIIDKEENKDLFRSLEVSHKARSNILLQDLYKDTSRHEIAKKDHAMSLIEAERKIDTLNEIATATIDTIRAEETTLGIYETLEDIATTVSDGFKLTSELRNTVESFRANIDENKTFLDTNSEAISSKNIKSSLVNIAEEMTLENNVAEADISFIAVSLIGLMSLTVVISLLLLLKQQTTRFDLF